uniref:RING-type domain-containing protein n=1 Tax=Gouania willdenowi TaxID=441366 RepID=A0A8C5HSP8_GOUWI
YLKYKMHSKASNELMINSVAFQDHITKTVLHPDYLCPWIKKTSKYTKVPRKTRQKVLQRGDEHEEREYVLEPHPPPLTLAQRMGLIAFHKERLTEDEWTRVKKRSVQQEESANPCSICREEFRLQPQVMLSCSHVFHRACLEAFERFSGRKCCAICRKEPYETRVIHDAARLVRHKCATRIQACWRGYRTRKWYQKFSKNICPQDKKLRRKFFETKVSSITHYVLCDIFYAVDIDRSLSSSRRVFQQLERMVVSKPREDDWERIKSQGIQRGVWECPICLTALSNPDQMATDESKHRCRRTVLLSCSHLFHQLCLEAFETFSSFTAHSRPTCPLCRSTYNKKLL